MAVENQSIVLAFLSLTPNYDFTGVATTGGVPFMWGIISTHIPIVVVRRTHDINVYIATVCACYAHPRRPPRLGKEHRGLLSIVRVLCDVLIAPSRVEPNSSTSFPGREPNCHLNPTFVEQFYRPQRLLRARSQDLH